MENDAPVKKKSVQTASYSKRKKKATRFTSYADGYGPEDDGTGFRLRDVIRFFLVDCIAILGLKMILSLGGVITFHGYIVTILLSKVILFAYLIWLIHYRRRAWTATGIYGIGRWWAWILGLVVYVLCFFFVFPDLNGLNQELLIKIYNAIGWDYMYQPQVIMELIASDVISDATRITLIVFAVLIGPFMEELAFRGMALDACWRRWGTFYAVIVSSLLFGLYHFDADVFLPLTALGGFFAVARIVSRTIWCPIFLHILHNTVTLILFAYQNGLIDPQIVKRCLDMLPF